MFHVEQNENTFLCETRDYLATGETFKIFLDENKIIGKTSPFPKKEEMDKYYESEDYYPHTITKKTIISSLYAIARKYMHRKKFIWMKRYLKENSNVLDFGCGSGDFVDFLRHKSVNAYGYDPKTKFNKPGSPKYLTDKEIWRNEKYDIID